MPYCNLLCRVQWVSLRGLLFPEEKQRWNGSGREGRWEGWLGGVEGRDTVVRMYERTIVIKTNKPRRPELLFNDRTLMQHALVMRGVGAEVSTACSEHGDSVTSKAIWMCCLGMSGSACPRQWTRSDRCGVASCREYWGGNSSFEFWGASKPGQVFCPRTPPRFRFPLLCPSTVRDTVGPKAVEGLT